MLQLGPLLFLLSRYSRRCILVFGAEVLDQDCLHRAGRRRALDLQARGVVGVGVVHERFLTVQFENGGSEKGALRVSQALIQINDNSHASIPLLLSRSTDNPAIRAAWREINLEGRLAVNARDLETNGERRRGTYGTDCAAE